MSIEQQDEWCWVPVQAVEQHADVNGDQKINLAEVIKVMDLAAQ